MVGRSGVGRRRWQRALELEKQNPKRRHSRHLSTAINAGEKKKRDDALHTHYRRGVTTNIDSAAHVIMYGIIIWHGCAYVLAL